MISICFSGLFQSDRSATGFIELSSYAFIRPPVRSSGRTYKMLVMFLFFPTRNLRDPSADHCETLPHDWKLVLFYNPTSKTRGALPQKNLGAKNMQNFGPFYTSLIANISGTA